MSTCAHIVFWVLGGLAVAQGLMACGFVWVLRRRGRVLLADDTCPKAAVILCLRGADPFLTDCMQALLNQDYPRYDVRVVVDHCEDPAWSVIEKVITSQQAVNVQLQPLTERRDTCSLKCSSQVQAISALDESYEVVALLDADTIPHRQWLSELIAPLADERVGASTGNRWYMPAEASWGALVRYAWNAAAIVQMYWFKVAWGGTLALKTKVLRESDLLDRWRHAFGEDTMLYTALRQQGLRIAFVPSLIMINREACEIAGVFRWVCRQLISARLHHPSWMAVVGHGISIALVLAIALGVSILAAMTKHWETAAWAGGGLVCYQTSLVLLLVLLEGTVRCIVRTRGEETTWLARHAIAKYLLAIPLTQGLYTAALVTAIRVRSVEWRSVSYRIDGRRKIRLIEYRPYETSQPSSGSIASL